MYMTIYASMNKFGYMLHEHNEELRMASIHNEPCVDIYHPFVHARYFVSVCETKRS